MKLLENVVSNVADAFVNQLIKNAPPPIITNQTAQDVAQAHQLSPMMLGIDKTQSGFKPRDRTQIYTKLRKMSTFAPLAEALNIHVANALGGDSFTNEVVMIKPASRLKKADLSDFEKMQLDQINARLPYLRKLINEKLFKVCYDGVTYGDAYIRAYGKKGKGLEFLQCDHLTSPPFIQAFEQANKTVAYQLLANTDNGYQSYAVLNQYQMKRLKMQRITEVDQIRLIDVVDYAQYMMEDDIDQQVPIPADVGGSFLLSAESAYDYVVQCLSAMSTQQIADSVKRMIFTINQEGTTPQQRIQYMQFFKKFVNESEKFTKNALENGEAIYKTQYGMLPQFGDKQAINLIGDISGQRVPINSELFMQAVRLMMGGVGLDPSMVGWAEQLAGGLGDGGSLRVSVQSNTRAQRIRSDLSVFIHEVIALDWFYAFGEIFEDSADRAWDIEFYSDMTASMTEQLSNQNQRIQSSVAKAQLYEVLKGLGFSESVVTNFLVRNAGMDDEEAMETAKEICKEPLQASQQQEEM